MKDNKELRTMTTDELQTELLSLRKDQFLLRMKKSNGALDKTHVVKSVRRTIARVKTIMTEKAGTTHVE
jgi:large subunit ribosomal protein L29